MAMQVRWRLLVLACVLASLLVPALASASTGFYAETRVGGLDLGNTHSVRVIGSLTLGTHQGYAAAYDDLASGSLLAARGAGGLVDDLAGAAARNQPNRIYSARELIRRAEEPGPFHNFPGSFDDVIVSQGQRTTTPGFFKTPRAGLSNESIQYRLPGNINGTQGTFEIFVRPSVSGRTEVIQHRFFRPN